MDSEQTESLSYHDREIEVERLFDAGWAGIVYSDVNTQELYLCWLEWRNGGYLDRVRSLSREEYSEFRKRHEND